MISLARQLALRREIEEEMGELAGHVCQREGDRLELGDRWRPVVRGEAQRDSDRMSKLRRRPLCAVCGVARRQKHKHTCSDACRTKAKLAARKRIVAVINAGRRAATQARRCGRPCAKCGAALVMAKSANRLFCDPCAVMRGRERANATRLRRQAAQQRRAA